MKKHFKKSLALLLCVVMLISIIPVMASAETEVLGSGKCGDNLTWTVTDDGFLTISGTGRMYDYLNPYDFTVEEGAAPWTKLTGKIDFLKLEEGISYIGNRAFFFCNFNYVDIPEGVYGIGDAAFWYNDIYVLRFPSTLNSVGMCAFFGCNDIIKICFNGSKEERSISFATENEPLYKESLWVYNYTSDSILATGTAGENITWSLDGKGNLVISGSGEMTSASWSLYNGLIKKVTVEDGITNICDNAFYSLIGPTCSFLTSVELPDTITEIGNAAFQNCSELVDINIPANVTSIGDDAFNYCRKLNNVNIPANVKSIGQHAFFMCSSLTTVILPDGLQSVGRGAFAGCGLRTVTIPKSVTSIGSGENRPVSSVFSGNNLEEIIVDELNEMYCSEDGILYNKDKTILIKYPAAKKGKEFNVPSGVTTIDINAFAGTELETITMPDTVTEINHGAFSGSAIRNITLPDAITYIAESIFYNCSNLENIIIPENVTSIGGYAFAGSSIKSIIIPEKVTSIAAYTFSGCSALTEITIPDLVKYIYREAFADCVSLSEINLPAELKEIRYLAFSDCSSLTDVVIPYGVRYIDESVFEGCTSLKNITIPNTIGTIRKDTFLNCDSLTDVYFVGIEEEWQNVDRYSGNEALWNATTHFCEHKNTEVIPGSEPTCEYIGFTSGVLCTDCKNTVVERERIPVLEHECTSQIITAATHLTEGKKQLKCINCSYSRYEIIEKLEEHTYYKSAITTSSTHLTEGVRTYYCQCGYTYTEPVAKLPGHSYTSEITTPATHLTEGVKTFSCLCGYSYTRPVAKLPGHTYITETTPPTCTTMGYTTYTCACGHSYASEYVPEIGHRYVSEITKMPTHTEYGIKTFTCGNCGDSYTEDIQKIPHHNYVVTEIIEPNCSSEGYSVYTCECGDYYYDDYVDYDYSVHVNEDGDKICDACGELTEYCSCNCHSTNSFIAFFWKILNFLQRLFGTNPVCECGMAHY